MRRSCATIFCYWFTKVQPLRHAERKSLYTSEYTSHSSNIIPQIDLSWFDIQIRLKIPNWSTQSHMWIGNKPTWIMFLCWMVRGMLSLSLPCAMDIGVLAWLFIIKIFTLNLSSRTYSINGLTSTLWSTYENRFESNFAPLPHDHKIHGL